MFVFKTILIVVVFHSFPEIDVEQVKNVNLKEIRPIIEQDFINSLKRIRRSVAPQSIIAYEKWAMNYGDVTY